MRLVLAGTPDVAVPTLEALAASDHDLVAVVTRPDARTGRGRRQGTSPVAAWARDHDLPVLQPAKAGDPGFLAELAALAPDCCPVVAYGALLPAAALAVPRHGWLNLHFSVLPAWRGAAPVQRALMAGDEFTGATVFRIDAGLDTGPVHATLTTAVRPRETAGDLLGRLAVDGAQLMVAALDAVAAGAAVPVPQPPDGVSHAPKITVDEAKVPWHLAAHVVDRHVRGCTPAPGAWTLLGDQRLKIGAPARVVQGDDDPASPAAARTGTPGSLVVERRRVLVETGTGWLELGLVQPPGRPAMPAADHARGARLTTGTVLA